MKCTLCGRADLLRSLSSVDSANHALLAELLGYELRSQESSTQATFNSTTALKTKQKQPESTPLLYEAKAPLLLWTVSRVAPLREDTWPVPNTEMQSMPETLPTESLVPDLPSIGLLSAGDWQNLWDGLIHKYLLSDRIDIFCSVLAISKALPLARLPRMTRAGSSRSAVLLLETSSFLRPFWHDLKQLIASLQKNYSSQDLQIYCLPHGPGGKWINAQDEALSCESIDSTSPVYLAGTFGVLAPGDALATAWQSLFEQLRARGNPVSFVSLVSALDVDAPVAVIDSRPLGQQHLLLASLSQCWRPTVTKLRRLRLAIPGASLADELWVYNHKDIERVGRQLPLKPETLLRYNHHYRGYSQSIKEPIEVCIKHWQERFQGEMAREAECVQQTLHNPPSLGTCYPRLRALAAAVNAQIQSGEVGAEAVFMRSILPLTEALAPRVEYDNSWNELLQSAQQLALYDGRSLPCEHRGLASTEKIGYLKQVGNKLVIDDNSLMAVISESLGNQSYCTETNKVIEQFIKPLNASFDIVDNHLRYTLSAIPMPNWATRLYRKPSGTLEAIYPDGPRFELIPASLELPNSAWRLAGGLWPWAQDAGIDDHGLWADLAVKASVYRLRWIPPGKFMMGSPDKEGDRDDDEQLHEVTLSEGYWLGETTVPQVLWETVMGKNPSEISKDGRLPVSMVSWYECSVFIKSLREYLPSFEACMPTEAQWEYACRTGTQTLYWWGDEFSAEHDNLHEGTGIKPESRYPANSFGLKSMHGNVWEWCQDWYGKYPTGAVMDPKGPTDGRDRVLRGGSWNSVPQRLRSAFRLHFTPDFRCQNFGLRLAGGCDPQAGKRRGAAQSADRDAGTQEQRGALGSPSQGKEA